MKTQTRNELVELPLVATLGTNAAHRGALPLRLAMSKDGLHARRPEGAGAVQMADPHVGVGCLLMDRRQPRSEAGSGRSRGPKRAKSDASGPSGMPLLASHVTTSDDPEPICGAPLASDSPTTSNLRPSCRRPLASFPAETCGDRLFPSSRPGGSAVWCVPSSCVRPVFSRGGVRPAQPLGRRTSAGNGSRPASHLSPTGSAPRRRRLPAAGRFALFCHGPENCV